MSHRESIGVPSRLAPSASQPLPRVAFVTSHPIQYQVPVFRCLAARDDLDFIVLFAMLPDAASQGAGFGVAFEWDIPLLEGYNYRVLKNSSAHPGVTHFRGCDTPEIAETLRELRVDVVIVNGWVVKTCLQALRAARKLKLPCIVRGEANNLRKRPIWKRIPQRILVRRYDAVLPIGKASREFYRSHGVPESRMFDALYCVENERFSRAAAAAESRRSELRAHWSIPGDAVCFLFCGKFEHKKHPLELVRAFLEAHRQLQQSASDSSPIHLLMVGDGELRTQCEELAARDGGPGDRNETQRAGGEAISVLAGGSSRRPDGSQRRIPVTFTGFLNQSQIVDAYVACDVLVLPSDAGETWGLVVNEAMACGKPAIVSDLVGCCADLIVQGRTGWSFPFGDWSSLSERIIAAAQADSQPAEMAKSCEDLIASYSPGAAAEGIAAAVRFVTGERT